MDVFNLCLPQTEARKHCYSLEILFCSEIVADFKDSFCTLVTDVLPNVLYKYRLDVIPLCRLLLTLTIQRNALEKEDKCNRLFGKFSCLF